MLNYHDDELKELSAGFVNFTRGRLIFAAVLVVTITLSVITAIILFASGAVLIS